jgi:hypothetical protein
MSISLLPRAGWPGTIVIVAVALIILIIVWSIIRVSLKARRRSDKTHRNGG